METDTEDLASPEAPDEVEKEDTVENVENVRSDEGHDEIARDGETEGDGEESRTGGARSNAAGSSIVRCCILVHTMVEALDNGEQMVINRCGRTSGIEEEMTVHKAEKDDSSAEQRN